MSRAMNLHLPQSEVANICESLGIVTTSIETLVPSGTRVVCRTSEGGALLRKKLRTSMIEGSIKRMPRSIRATW